MANWMNSQFFFKNNYCLKMTLVSFKTDNVTNVRYNKIRYTPYHLGIRNPSRGTTMAEVTKLTAKNDEEI